MESTTPLSLYLEKLAAGERELAPIICQKLSQQLVYVPVVSGGRSKSEGKVVFQVVKLPEGNVPVFTTEHQYKEWAAQNNEATEVFTVLGGDLCATVGERATVVLDLGSPHSSVLDAALMQLVATAARESIVEERSLRIDGSVASPAESGAETQSSASAAMKLLPSLKIPAHEPVADASPPKAEPILDPLRGRSNPTSIMARPQRPRMTLEHHLDTHAKPQETPKPVITTQDPDSAKLIRTKTDPKKAERRSLLKFLGG